MQEVLENVLTWSSSTGFLPPFLPVMLALSVRSEAEAELLRIETFALPALKNLTDY